MVRVSIYSVLQVVFVLAMLGVISLWIRPQTLSGQSLTPPPVPSFLDETGRVLVNAQQIIRGQSVAADNHTTTIRIHPETTEQIKELMRGYHAGQRPEPASELEAKVRNASIARRVELELAFNRYDPVNNAVTLTESQIVALQSLRIAQQDTGDSLRADDHTAYLFWAGWMRGVARPNYDTSYRTLSLHAFASDDTPSRSEQLLVPFLLLILIGATIGVARSLAAREPSKHALA
jgi:hypothetical protein